MPPHTGAMLSEFLFCPGIWLVLRQNSVRGNEKTGPISVAFAGRIYRLIAFVLHDAQVAANLSISRHFHHSDFDVYKIYAVKPEKLRLLDLRIGTERNDRLDFKFLQFWQVLRARIFASVHARRDLFCRKTRQKKV